MSDTYAEDARLDREADEEFEQWCDALDGHDKARAFKRCFNHVLRILEQDKEEEDGQSTSSS